MARDQTRTSAADTTASLEPSRVEIQGLTKRFGDIVAVDDIDFVAEEGELTTLVGPSGCGKTTTLRCIAGFERPSVGNILIGDEIVNDTERGIFRPPQDRDIGFVFQTFDVWTHMSVFENVAFPLNIRDYSKDEIEEKVHNILELANIGDLKDKNATDLSGGQQARVGICRALVYEPKVLLCDEPLTGLDRNLRSRMRQEIRSIQQEIGITTIYVTHSQPEAMEISDKLCLMTPWGTIAQCGSGSDIYNHPVSKYSFEFFGTSQFFPGQASGSNGIATDIGPVVHDQSAPAGDGLVVGFRPEEVELSPDPPDDWSENVWRGTIDDYSFLGETHKIRVTVDGGFIDVRQSRLADEFDEGDAVYVHINPSKIHIFPED